MSRFFELFTRWGVFPSHASLRREKSETATITPQNLFSLTITSRPSHGTDAISTRMERNNDDEQTRNKPPVRGAPVKGDHEPPPGQPVVRGVGPTFRYVFNANFRTLYAHMTLLLSHVSHESLTFLLQVCAND
jgi:hypothetical protein